MTSIIQKGIIPARSQDKKFSNQCETFQTNVKYEGQVRSQHLLFVQFSR